MHLISFLVVTLLASVHLHASNPAVVNISLNTDPPNLNYVQNIDGVSLLLIYHLEEGLTQYSKLYEGSISPGVAVSWDLKLDSITFRLRKDAKWSDGSQVTAHDFVYAWQKAIDPKTANNYAFFFYPILNAELIAQNKLTPDHLGVEAVDDHTLRVRFAKPCPYFASLTAFPAMYPVPRAFYRNLESKGQTYASSPQNMLYNGAFTLEQWTHGSKIKLVKNSFYWNSNQTKLAAIQIPIISNDARAKYHFFLDHKLDILTLEKNELEMATQNKGASNLLKHLETPGAFYIEFNQHSAVSKNLNLRKAIACVFNHTHHDYISAVQGTLGTKISQSFVPLNLTKESGTFAYQPKPCTMEQALAWVKQAKSELGSLFRPLTWLASDSESSKREAEFMQELLRKKLGLELMIETAPLKQWLVKTQAGQFDMIASGWGPDYPDPTTFLETKTSWSQYNLGRWTNSKYDQLITLAQHSTKTAERLRWLAQAQKILLDDVGIIPLYDKVFYFAQNPKIKNVAFHTFGPMIDLTRAEISP